MGKFYVTDFTISSSDRSTQLAATAFDACAWDLWPYLTAGSTIYLVKAETILNPEKLRDWLVSKQITITFVPTPLAEKLLALDWTENIALRTMLTGGDRLSRFWEDSLPFELINNYGPTENTVFATSGLVPSPESVLPPIGRPIANTIIYILDKHLQPLPIGVPGELHIGGAGLARGYLNRPELTQQKFIPNPFSNEPGSRLYKTGDLARYLPDGNIEFLERIDNQVKIRGFRIELGEIEAVLAQHSQVRETVVMAREDIPGDKRLVAYLVINDAKITINDLRSFLKTKLPEYMIPAAFVLLEAIPLTPNGKVNRRGLPVPDDSSLVRETSFIAPRDSVELQLAQIWSEVLSVSPIGVRDNFFDLGGHSLLAVSLMANIEKQFGKNLSLAALFQGGTVEQLAILLGQKTDTQSWSGLVAIQPQGNRPPFFCMPGSGGNVVYFHQLARHLGNNQPFYALQPDVLLHGNYWKYLVITGNNFLLQWEHGSGYPLVSLDATS